MDALSHDNIVTIRIKVLSTDSLVSSNVDLAFVDNVIHVGANVLLARIDSVRFLCNAKLDLSK